MYIGIAVSQSREEIIKNLNTNTRWLTRTGQQCVKKQRKTGHKWIITEQLQRRGSAIGESKDSLVFL